MAASLIINVRYDAIWGNSFLDGNNNEPLPGKGRNYIGSGKGLRTHGIARKEITQDTVMGLLNRLIGDPRKLYQSRVSDDYYFKDLEDNEGVSFDNLVDYSQQDLVFLRNLKGSTDQSLFSGVLKTDIPLFTSEIAIQLWGVIFLTPEELCDFILNESYSVPPAHTLNPKEIGDYLKNTIGSMDGYPVDAKDELTKKVLEAERHLEDLFESSYRDPKGIKIFPKHLFCGAIYLMEQRLQKKLGGETGLLNHRGNISGISKRSYTHKDFMKIVSSPKGKIVWGGPYMIETSKLNVKSTESVTKSGGLLSITVNSTLDQCQEIKKMIENASVMTFRLGKKGLAYVDSIKVNY